MTYHTEEAAIARVDRLKIVGIWPGIIHMGPGAWRLTYDPPMIKGELDAHGYLMDPGSSWS